MRQFGDGRFAPAIAMVTSDGGTAGPLSFAHDRFAQELRDGYDGLSLCVPIAAGRPAACSVRFVR